MRLAIIHYHLRKGGVTRVIASALEALGPEVDKAVVLSSTPSEEPLPCPVAVIPELAYTTEASSARAEKTYRTLLKQANESLGGPPDIWHIHNHSLGKNVNFPEVVRRLIQDDARILLQIHDFSEDGRPGNYKDQRRPYAEGVFENFDKSLYPLAPQIGYAVLNGRDREILLQSGIPEEQLFWLPNAVTVPELVDQSSVRSGRKEPPLILYPTRAIRRKNLGELLLLAAMYPDFRYATTLSPKNPQWTRIHDDWSRLAKRLDLPVAFALGEQRGHSFEGLINEAHAIVTTSVGEGFGLAFLEPWLFGKPVIGRDLPDITRDFKENGIALPDLYSEWPVSCRLFDSAAQESRFIKTARGVYEAYEKDFSDDDAHAAWESLTGDGSIDFAFLDETAQAEIIRAVASGGSALKADAPINPHTIDASVLKGNQEKIRRMYGLSHYGKSLLSIYRKLLDSTPAEPGNAMADSILTEFLDLRRMRLLRT